MTAELIHVIILIILIIWIIVIINVFFWLNCYFHKDSKHCCNSLLWWFCWWSSWIYSKLWHIKHWILWIKKTESWDWGWSWGWSIHVSFSFISFLSWSWLAPGVRGTQPSGRKYPKRYDCLEHPIQINDSIRLECKAPLCWNTLRSHVPKNN